METQYKIEAAIAAAQAEGMTTNPKPVRQPVDTFAALSSERATGEGMRDSIIIPAESMAMIVKIKNQNK